MVQKTTMPFECFCWLVVQKTTMLFECFGWLVVQKTTMPFECFCWLVVQKTTMPFECFCWLWCRRRQCNVLLWYGYAGPRGNTVEDMWWMVWQERVTHIVMLTNTVEKDKV